MRDWRLFGGGHPLRAAFLAAEAGEVRLRPADGGEIRVSLAVLSDPDRNWVRFRLAAPKEDLMKSPPPAIQKGFEPFKDRLKFRWYEDWLYVESDGLPDHPMMKGIKS